MIKLIRSELTYPDFARAEELQCCVALKIEIQEDGSLKVTCANCPNEKLKEYVEQKVESIHSDKLAQAAGQEVMIRLKFSFVQN